MSPLLLLLAILVVFAIAAAHHVTTSGYRSEAAATSAPAEPREELRAGFGSLVRRLSAAVSFGAIVGAVVGGIGGRVAMRLLFLTSPDGVKGIRSDDGFEIGKFDLVDTLNLIALGALVGVLGGLIYLAIRRWLPRDRRSRTATSGAIAAAIVGSLIIHPDGIDFRFLDPLWFAIALFLLIPALFGAIVQLLVDGADEADSWFQRKRLAVAASPLVLLLFPPAFITLAGPIGIVFLGRWATGRSPRMLQIWESRQFQWAGWITLAGLVALSLFYLVDDVRQLA